MVKLLFKLRLRVFAELRRNLSYNAGKRQLRDGMKSTEDLHRLSLANFIIDSETLENSRISALTRRHISSNVQARPGLIGRDPAPVVNLV